MCDAASAAVICVQASPDRAVEFDIGGESVLPGECARAPERGGAVRVAWTIAGGPWNDRRIRAPRHRRTEVALGADATLEVMTRHRCGPSMAPFVPLR